MTFLGFLSLVSNFLLVFFKLFMTFLGFLSLVSNFFFALVSLFEFLVILTILLFKFLFFFLADFKILFLSVSLFLISKAKQLKLTTLGSFFDFFNLLKLVPVSFENLFFEILFFLPHLSSWFDFLSNCILISLY